MRSTATFGGGYTQGYFFSDASQLSAVVTQADGKVVAAGFGFNQSGYEEGAVIRLAPGGTPDTGFPASGIAALDDPAGDDIELTSIALAPDGRIVVAGRRVGTSPAVIVARYWP